MPTPTEGVGGQPTDPPQCGIPPHRAMAGASILPDGSPPCSECGGRMWDNRASKRNPRAPDFKCRNRECAGRIWPGRLDQSPRQPPAPAGEPAEDVLDTPLRPRGPLANTVDAVLVTVGAANVRVRAREVLHACYLDLTDFVLAEVRPKYEAAGVPCSDGTVAAIAATLFNATCDATCGRDATGVGDLTTPSVSTLYGGQADAR